MTKTCLGSLKLWHPVHVHLESPSQAADNKHWSNVTQLTSWPTRSWFMTVNYMNWGTVLKFRRVHNSCYCRCYLVSKHNFLCSKFSVFFAVFSFHVVVINIIGWQFKLAQSIKYYYAAERTAHIGFQLCKTTMFLKNCIKDGVAGKFQH